MRYKEEYRKAFLEEDWANMRDLQRKRIAEMELRREYIEELKRRRKEEEEYFEFLRRRCYGEEDE